MNIELAEKLKSATLPELYALAYRDGMTGVLNRRAFEADTRGWVLLLDLDSFKWINDTFGHEAGDRTIQIFAKLLVDQFGEDNVYRIGGDEFAVKFDVPTVVSDKLEIVAAEVPGFSSGSGMTVKDADENLYQNKLHRTRTAQRCKGAPPWAARFYRNYARLPKNRRTNRV